MATLSNKDGIKTDLALSEKVARGFVSALSLIVNAGRNVNK